MSTPPTFGPPSDAPFDPPSGAQPPSQPPQPPSVPPSGAGPYSPGQPPPSAPVPGPYQPGYQAPTYQPVGNGPAPGFGQPGAAPYQQGPPTAFPSYSAMPTDVVGDSDAPARRGGKSFLPWLIGIVVVALIGGGIFAVQAAISSDDAQPASALPASSILYGRIDVDPSAGQKIQALRLANKFPGFRDNIDLPDINADLREKLFDTIRGDTPELADVDYDADVAPWLGNRIGFGMIPGATEDDDPIALLAMQVKDAEAAKVGLTKILAAGNGTGGFVMTGDYALIAETTELAEKYAAEAAQSSLADNADFKASLNDLGDQGVASFWVSKDAYTTLAKTAQGMTPEDLGSIDDLGLLGGSQAFAVRFGDRYVEIASAQRGGDLGLTSAATDNPAAKLPDSTLFEFSLGNGKEVIDNAWDKLTKLATASDASFGREVKRFEKATGLTIPEDIGTLLGDGFTFAVDNQDFSALDDPASLRIGALMDTDVDAAQAVIDAILENIPAAAEFNLQRVESDGLLAVSTNKDYATKMSQGSLGDTDTYKLAVQDGGTAAATMFFNFDLLEGSTLDMLKDAGVTQEVIDNLTPLQAVGASSTVSGDLTHSSIRIVVNE